METPPGLPILFEEWEKTPLMVKAVVIALGEENRTLKRQVTALESQVKGLQAEVEKLKEQVK